MPTNLDKHWNEIVDACKQRIIKDKKAGIKSVIAALNLPSPTTEDIQIIDGYLTDKGEYKSITIDNEVFISKDHNYKLNNLVKTNAIVTMTLAGVTTLFIVLGHFKKPSLPDLTPIYKQLQQTSKLLDSMRLSQKGIDSSLRTMANDSLKK